MIELYSNSTRSKKRFFSRRDLLFEAGGGVSGLALVYLLNQDGLLAAEPSKWEAQACAPSVGTSSSPTTKPPHFKARAK